MLAVGGEGQERGEVGQPPPVCVCVCASARLHPWAPAGGERGREPRGWGVRPRAWPLLTGSTKEKAVIYHRVPHSAEPQAGLRPPQSRPLQSSSSSGSQTLSCPPGQCLHPGPAEAPTWLEVLPGGSSQWGTQAERPFCLCYPENLSLKKDKVISDGTHKMTPQVPQKEPITEQG